MNETSYKYSEYIVQFSINHFETKIDEFRKIESKVIKITNQNNHM